jgi:hypothetical protein
MYPSHFEVTDRSVLNITHVFELVHDQKWQPFASMMHLAKSDTMSFHATFLVNTTQLLCLSCNSTDLEGNV